MMRSALTMTCIGLALAVTGCGSDGQEPSLQSALAPAPPVDPATSAPALYEPSTDADAAARAGKTAKRFLTAYLSKLYGHGTDRRTLAKTATAELIASFKEARTPATWEGRQPRIETLQLTEGDQFKGDLRFSAAIDDGQLPYALQLRVIKTNEGWKVAELQ